MYWRPLVGAAGLSLQPSIEKSESVSPLRMVAMRGAAGITGRTPGVFVMVHVKLRTYCRLLEGGAGLILHPSPERTDIVEPLERSWLPAVADAPGASTRRRAR